MKCKHDWKILKHAQESRGETIFVTFICLKCTKYKVDKFGEDPNARINK